MTRDRLRRFVRAAIHLAVLRPLIRLYCGVQVNGSAHLHELKQFIIIANHNSHLDVLLLFSLLSARDISMTHPVAAETYFSRWRPIYALLGFLLQPLWVRSGSPEGRADPLRGMKDRLDRGHNVILFPEGTRGQPGQIGLFKSGIGRLVSQYPDLPIVPVFLSGPERVLPKKSWIPLPFWSQVVIGPPQICNGPHRDITHHLQNILSDLSHSRAVRKRPRQRRRPEPAPAVAVLGIDGSGKSTLSRQLAERLSAQSNACLVSDHLVFYDHGETKPIQPLGIEALRSWVGRYAKQAHSLAAYKVPKLTELILRDRLLAEVSRWYAPETIVQDGSPLLNMAAWAALYKMEGLSDATLASAMSVLAGQGPRRGWKDPLFRVLPELGRLDRLGLTHLQLPRVLVLLDVAPSVACQRIAARGQPRQPHETEEKLQRLREAYLRVVRIISEHWRIPTHVVDGAQPLQQAVEETFKFVRTTLPDPHTHEPSH